ncbi:MAG: Nif3-like dinuclear metal center hexameric protein [Anaerovoracaceae bacterium]
MQKSKFKKIMESICPSELAEDWDNCGFQVNTEYTEVNKVLVSLEITDDVIEEAVENDADLIVTHHPMIFQPIRNVDSNDVTGSYLIKLILAGISVYSCHTSFDKMNGGNNDYIGNLLGLTDIEPFEEDNGFCRRGVTPFNVTFDEFADRLAASLGLDRKSLRLVGDRSREIFSVGWCTGAGAEFLPDAIREGLDLYITGDLKYHDAQLAKAEGICVLDAGHYGTEINFVDNMASLLECKTNLSVIKSKVRMDPFAE